MLGVIAKYWNGNLSVRTSLCLSLIGLPLLTVLSILLPIFTIPLVSVAIPRLSQKLLDISTMAHCVLWVFTPVFLASIIWLGTGLYRRGSNCAVNDRVGRRQVFQAFALRSLALGIFVFGAYCVSNFWTATFNVFDLHNIAGSEVLLHRQ